MKKLIVNFLNEPADNRFLITVIVLSAFIVFIYPLTLDHQFRLNQGVSWVGAFRLMEGQLPYKDFGIPMGVGFFIIPAVFFKLISPQFFTLLIAQLCINIVFLFTTYKLFSALSLPKVAKALGMFSLIFLYLAKNYWPWYNNSVIFYELVSLTFLIYSLTTTRGRVIQIIYVLLAGSLSFLTFITKQDAGALTILISFALLVYHGIVYRDYLLLPVFLGVLVGAIIWYFQFFKEFDIHYWFNYGQPPHFSRLSLHDILKDFFLLSQWEKFYLSITTVFFFSLIVKDRNSLFSPLYFKRNLYLILTIMVLLEAMIFQVTSYNPPQSNIYYHAFGISMLVYIGNHYGFRYSNSSFIILSIIILFIFSNNLWKRATPKLTKLFPELMTPPPQTVVSKDNFEAIDTLKRQPVLLTTTNTMKTLNRMKIPVEVLEGIERMKKLDVIWNNPNAKVLNMSELTFLEYELGVDMLRGSDKPLWYHVGVCMFDREIQYFQKEVDLKTYDLVIFQTVPYWKDYYPFAVREHIVKHYQMIDSFIDIKGMPDTFVEVYIRK